MSYSETLSNMIKTSGLTMKEIADQIKIDPSYLSKLQSGKQSPASDEVNIAIAKACKADPDLLLFEGYIDKAPEIVRKFFSKFTDSIKEIILLASPNDKNHNNLDNISAIDFINTIYGSISLTNKDSGELSIFLGNDNLHLTTNPFYGFPMEDESMEPLIKNNSLVNVAQIFTDVSEGDIAVVNTPNNKNLIRRIFFINDQILLIPENKVYSKEIFHKDDVEFVGRVNSMTVKI